jgi:hypothetical protein
MAIAQRAAAATGCFVIVAAVACGSSSGDSTFGDGTATSGEGGAGSSGQDFGAASSGASGGASSTSSSTGGASGGAPDGAAGGALGDGGACAATKAAATLVPVYLIIMFDRSGSMADLQKWPSCVAGMESFFAAPASNGLYASLQFFTQPNECSVAAYATPAVPVTALPNAAPFTAALNATSPQGFTPTLPALKGAVQYAQTVKAGLTKGEKVAVVLVTDGDPNHCSANPNNAAAAAAEVGAFAATVAATIPTYVIGVGPDAANLTAIATGGGTAPPIMVSTTSPAQTTADILKAINQIKASTLGCDYTLPAPPAGQVLDINAVNVIYTPGGGGTPVTLPYSATCADPTGWHFDSTTTPTKVVMCGGRCSALQADTTGGKIDIEFGCVSPGGPGTSSSSSSSAAGGPPR